MDVNHIKTHGYTQLILFNGLMGFLSIALNKGDHDFGGLLRMTKGSVKQLSTKKVQL